MKRKIFSILFALVLVASFSLVTAVPVGAANPTTIVSSTMIFEGTLIEQGDGVFTGTIFMVDEAGASLGDLETGFDVYARDGATAAFVDERFLVGPTHIIAGHDAYPGEDPQQGGWNPDVPDWNCYALTLTADSWRLVYNNSNTAPADWAVCGGVPMSGTMDWTDMYAAETDLGYCFGGPVDVGPENPDYIGWAAGNGGGAACWDMDWLWGGEVVPLQYGGFAVLVTGTGPYTVTLTPAAGPVTNTTTGVNYGTIQSAIDAASPGDTINVAAGDYAGAVVNKAVKIIGAAGGASIITSGVPYKDGNDNLHSAFRPEADGAEIRNFTINCSEGLDLGVYAVEVNDVTVDSLTINDGTIQGITNWGGSDWVITNNAITDTVASSGGGIGIFLGAKAQQQCSGNLVQYNTIDATATAETYSCAGIALCLDTRYGGYDLLDDTEDVSGNQILDNTINAVGAYNSVGIEVGTILGDSETDPLRNNPDAIAALMVAGAVRDNVVQGNTIDGAETGIYFYNVTDLTVTQNEIKNSVDNGIYVEHGHSGIAVNYNNIYGNAFGFEHEDIPEVDYGSIDATLNWWGATDGPYHLNANPDGSGNAVSDNVNFYPYLGSPYEESGAAVSFITTTEEPVIGIEVSPTFINFGAISAGITVTGDTLTVTNTGNMPMSVSADLTEDTFYSVKNYFYTKALYLNEKASNQEETPTTLGAWTATDLGLKLVDPSPGAGYPYFSTVTTKLIVPEGITLGATYTSTVVFWAELALD